MAPLLRWPWRRRPPAEAAVSPEAEAAVSPEVEAAVSPEVEAAVSPEVEAAVSPEVGAVASPEVGAVASREGGAGVSPALRVAGSRHGPVALAERARGAEASATLPAVKRPRLQEIGATGTVYFAGVIADEYNSNLAGARGIETYDKMRRSDAQVQAVLWICELPLRSATWTVEPASESARDVEIAEAVQANLLDGMSITWDDFLRHTLLMLAYGHSVFEKVWERRDGMVALHKLAPRLPVSIAKWDIERDGGLKGVEQLVWTGTAYERPYIPVEKLLVFVYRKEGANWMGQSLLRAAYKHWYYKDQFYRIDAIANERHGVGVPYVRMGANADEGDYTEAASILASLHAHEQGYVVGKPVWEEFSILGVGSAGGGTLKSTLESISHHDVMMARSVLAQFLNLGAGETGSYALSQDQSSFFLLALRALANQICDTVNEYAIKPLVDLNWTVEAYPKLTCTKLETRDLASYGAAVKGLIDSGAIVVDEGLRATIRDMYGLPEEDPDEVAAQLARAERLARAAATEQGQDAEGGDGQGGKRPAISERTSGEGGASSGVDSADESDKVDRADKADKGEPAASPKAGVAPDRTKRKGLSECGCGQPHRGRTPGVDRMDLVDGPEVRPGSKPEVRPGSKPPFRPFWRELRASEDRGVLEGLRDALDQGKQQYLAAARRVVAKQMDRLIELVLPVIEAKNVAKLSSLSVPYKAELADAMTAVLRGVYLEGKASVGAERQVKTKRTAPVSLALIDPELMAEDFLAAKARSAANLLATRLLGALTWEALDQIKDGRVEESGLQSVLEALSEHNLADMANTSIPEASSLGRRDAFAEIADEIDHVEYSAILDENVCEVCKKLDGLEVTLDDPRYQQYMPPNPECLGGNRCRCVWVGVFRAESKAVVGPEPREGAGEAGAGQPDGGIGQGGTSGGATRELGASTDLREAVPDMFGARDHLRSRPVVLTPERAAHAVEKPGRLERLQGEVETVARAVSNPEFISTEIRWDDAHTHPRVTLLVPSSVRPDEYIGVVVSLAALVDDTLPAEGAHQVWTYFPVPRRRVWSKGQLRSDRWISVRK